MDKIHVSDEVEKYACSVLFELDARTRIGRSMRWHMNHKPYSRDVIKCNAAESAESMESEVE